MIETEQFTETTKPTASATSEAADGTTHTFNNAPPSAVDDDENEDDKAGMADVIYSLSVKRNLHLYSLGRQVVKKVL